MFILKGGATWKITAPGVASLARAFPNVEVMPTLEQAALWCESNPGKRKTAKGMMRFLQRWLGRSKAMPPKVAAEVTDWDALAFAYEPAKGAL